MEKTFRPAIALSIFGIFALVVLISQWFHRTMTGKNQIRPSLEMTAKIKNWHKGDLIHFTNGHVSIFVMKDEQFVTLTDGSEWYRSSTSHVVPRVAQVISTNDPRYAESSMAFVRQQFVRPSPGIPR